MQDLIRKAMSDCKSTDNFITIDQVVRYPKQNEE